MFYNCLLYTSDAADEARSVDLGCRRTIKKKTPIFLPLSSHPHISCDSPSLTIQSQLFFYTSTYPGVESQRIIVRQLSEGNRPITMTDVTE
ncbi:hypothetical protein PVA38_10730 [Streptococcus pneumoniae D39]|nr:hypothetical protein PVA38_10730 [Streptococcus pneumoniae D39]